MLNRTVGRSIIGNSYKRMSCISIALPPPGPSSCWNRQAQCSQVCCSPIPKSRLLHPNCQTLEVWFITPENMCPLLWSPVLYTTACKTFHVRLGCSLTWVSWSATETRSMKLSMCCSRANLEAFIPRRFHFVILTVEYSALHRRHPLTVPRWNVLSSWQRPILSQMYLEAVCRPGAWSSTAVAVEVIRTPELKDLGRWGNTLGNIVYYIQPFS